MINYNRVRTIKRFIYAILAVLFFAPAILAIVLFFQLQELKNEVFASNAELTRLTNHYLGPLNHGDIPDNIIMPQAPEAPTPEQPIDTEQEKPESILDDDALLNSGESQEAEGSAAISPSANGASGNAEDSTVGAELEPETSPQTNPANQNTSNGSGVPGNSALSNGIANPSTGSGA